MAAPLSINKNNYHNNVKNSTVFTPENLSYFLANIFFKSAQCKYSTKFNIFDPCVGTGNLFKPFKVTKDMYGNEIIKNKYTTFGMDINNSSNRKYTDYFLQGNFLDFTGNWNGKDIRDQINLILINPPFNTDSRNKKWLKEKKLGKALLPDLFMKKIFNIFGNKQPVIMITPMGFRLNNRVKSKRPYSWLENYSTSNITSIVSLPLDIFNGVEFHVEVLFWNITGIKAHYWYAPRFFENENKEILSE